MISRQQAQSLRDALQETLDDYLAPFDELASTLDGSEPIAKACEVFSDNVRRSVYTLTDELLQEEVRVRERFGSALKFFPPIAVTETKKKTRTKKITEETDPASPPTEAPSPKENSQ